MIDEKIEGYESKTRRQSQRHPISNVDGITAIVPHLGAHLAELTTISGERTLFIIQFNLIEFNSIRLPLT